MLFPKILLASFLASQATAILATFDEANINLNNYQSATYAQFTVVKQNFEGSPGITAASGSSYLKSQNAGAQSPVAQANGTLLLDTHSTTGHLNSYYLGCFTSATFVPGSYSCNFTMTAHCYDKNNNIGSYTLKQQYTRSDNKMDLLDLTGFYQFYAGLGYFAGNGSAAKCGWYEFHAVSAKSGDSFAVGFFIDSMTYTINP